MRWLALLLWVGPLGAQSVATGQYNEANALYRAGEFDQARLTYLEVTATGVQDARLYYNLGNACFKSSKLGEAILWYERARRLAPHDEDIEANLRFANLVKKDRDSTGGQSSLSHFIIRAYFWPSLDQLSLFFALAIFAIFALGVRRLYFGALSSLWLAGMLLCSGLSAGAATWLGTRFYYQSSTIEAVVMAERTIARSGPDEGQTEVFEAHAGTKVRLVRREGGWVLVRLVNGLGGWMQAEVVERI
jgi:tetratricopeptide (TPR) repeat protein